MIESYNADPIGVATRIGLFVDAKILLLSQRLKQVFTFELSISMDGIEWVLTPHTFLIRSESFSSGIESYNADRFSSYMNCIWFCVCHDSTCLSTIKGENIIH